MAEDFCRTIHEHRAHHDEEHHAEHEHHVARSLAEVFADEGGQVGSVVTHGEHTAEEIVGGTGKDAAEDDPEVCRRTELGSHDGTEDRSRAGDVEKLDHENLPVGHRHIVDAVVYHHGGSLSVVRSEHFAYELSIQEIAQHKGYKANEKCYHRS